MRYSKKKGGPYTCRPYFHDVLVRRLEALSLPVPRAAWHSAYAESALLKSVAPVLEEGSCGAIRLCTDPP